MDSDRSRAQRFAGRIVSEERFAAIERESRRWVMDCECGVTTSVWEMGGIRYKASSAAKYTYGRCAACGRRLWGRLYRLDS